MSLVLFKNSIRNFQNSFPFDRSACFYVTITGNFKHSPYVNLEAFKAFLRIFWRKKKKKDWKRNITMQNSYQKPILRQIECQVRNRPITKNWTYQ